MYLVDTDVLSETRRKSDRAVGFMRSVERELVYVSVMTLGEIRKGFDLKARRDPVGARPILSWLEAVRREYDQRILPVTDEIALEWGRLESQRPRGPDGLIAATALVRGLTLVTRNTADFRDVPIGLVDPWAVP